MGRTSNGNTNLRKAEQLDELIGYHLRRASAFDVNDFVVHFSDVGLRPVPFSVLCMIAERPGATAADLCRILILQRANIVQLLADLEEAKLIERRTDKTDQRIKRLFLSKTGTSSLASWKQRVAAREKRLFGALSADERAQLLRLLRKIWKADD